jgi:transposase-like protein
MLLLLKRFEIVSETFQSLTPMYSTADIAKRLGCTAQAVNKYRRKIEKRDGKRLGKPDPTDGRRTLFSEDEVALIAEMAPKIPVTSPDEDECLEAELIEGEDTTVYTPPSSISLGLRRTALPAVERQRFDVATAEQETADIQHHTAHIAQRGDALLSDFAVGEMVAAAADIKRTIATMKANALGDAVAQLGKPPSPQDGEGI